MKKFLAIILCAIMLLPAIPIIVSAETYGDLTYKKYDDHITITDCKFSATSVDIPAEIDGLSVTRIGNEAFRGCGLKSVTIPDSVTSIGKYAFESCKRLTSITIPNSITRIDEGAFFDCGNLTSVTIPNSVTSIGNWAFYECDSLTNITIPSSVTSIGGDAFARCVNLTSVTIETGVTSIVGGAFADCYNLLNITIPSSVTSIDGGAFSGCGSLNISVDSGNKNYTDIDGVLFNKNKTEIVAYAKDEIQTEYSIPSSVTSIGEGAFYGCDSLMSVTIPDSVTSIGYWAFEDCNRLTSITIPKSVTSIDDRAFANCFSLTDVYYGGSEEDWQKINIGGYYYLTGATIHYNSDVYPRIEVSEPVVEGGSITITAERKNIGGEGELFAVGYDGNKLTASEKLQDGAATLPAEDVQTIKVFCWDGLDTMRPLCEPKTITIK